MGDELGIGLIREVGVEEGLILLFFSSLVFKFF